MVIQDLKPPQQGQESWLVVLQDGSILRVGEKEVVDFSLYRGKELSEEERRELQLCIRRSSLKEKALLLLNRKPLSRRELERKLEEWGGGEEDRFSICDRLEELNFLNDGRYACQVVRYYAGKGYGVKKLRDELYRRGVPRELWEDALAEAEESTSVIDAFLEKKLKGCREAKELKRASDALARRGYPWSEINAALRRYGAEPEEW